MKQLKTRVTAEQMTAQQALDEIMQLEIEMAEEMAAAQDSAEETLSQVESEMDQIRKSIPQKARTERDQLFKEGIAAAQQATQANEEAAAAAGQRLEAAGQKFIREAAERVLSIVVPDSKKGAP